jgi:hypothetical protein
MKSYRNSIDFHKLKPMTIIFRHGLSILYWKFLPPKLVEISSAVDNVVSQRHCMYLAARILARIELKILLSFLLLCLQACSRLRNRRF